MTGEAVGILQTKTALVPGSYEHTAIVKDNAGAISSLTINIIVRNPESPDSKLQLPNRSSSSTMAQSSRDGPEGDIRLKHKVIPSFSISLLHIFLNCQSIAFEIH